MIKMMQQVLKKQIDEAEAVYLTMHLYRIAKKNKFCARVTDSIRHE